MSYNVKVNGNVLPELYTEEAIRGYAAAWREYRAEVQVALSGTHAYVSLARFLGEPEAPRPASGPLLPPAYAPPQSPGFVPPPTPTGPFGPGHPGATSAPPTGFMPPPIQSGNQGVHPGLTSSAPAGFVAPFSSTGFRPTVTGPLPPSRAITAAPTKNGLAISGLVFGILGICGIFTCGLTSICCIPGLILSLMANSRATNRPREYGGKGMAVTGMVLSILTVVTIPFIASIAVPNLLAARRSANEASAQQSLRNIRNAQFRYRETIGHGEYARSLRELGQARLIDDSVANMEHTPKSGYLVVKFETRPATSTTEATFSVVVSPAQRVGLSRSGSRSFYTDDSEIIRHSQSPSEDATANSLADDED